MRMEQEVVEFFDSCSRAKEKPGNPNGHLPFVLEDVRELLSRRNDFNVPAEGTVYTIFLQQKSQEIIRSLVQEHEVLQDKLKVVLVSGPVAYGYAVPFHTFIEGQKLPPQTTLLFGVIYNWLFTFLGKSSRLSDTRFLDDDLTSTLTLHFFFTDQSGMTEQELTTLIANAFTADCNFSPPIVCRLRAIDEMQLEDILASYCILGANFVANFIYSERTKTNHGDFYQTYTNVVEQIVDELPTAQHVANLKSPSLLHLSDQIIDNYQKARSRDDAFIFADLSGNSSGQPNDWFIKNKPFFQQLKENDFDLLVVEDSTKLLQDKKGAEKDNQFTISRVKGLKKGDGFIPAFNIVLKLRGLTHYRGDINNYLDLIKEYVSYVYIHCKLSAPSPYLLNTGPLLFTCEKLSVPFGREETRNWIGFFLEEVPAPAQERVFTCRVRFLSDFWTPGKSIQKVLNAANDDDIQLDERQLRKKLRELSVWLWSAGLSVDYCDLIFYLDHEHRITRLLMVDLERLSFSELVNEAHLVLNSFVDLKSRLLKTHWYEVLKNVYLTKESATGFNTLSNVRQYLRPPDKKRTLALVTLHRLEQLSNQLGTNFGRNIWKDLLGTLTRLSAVRGRNL